MPFDEFERSNSVDKFEDFNSYGIMVVWLDLLGTRRLRHQEMVTQLDNLLNIANKASSLGPIVGNTLIGTPQWLFQYAVVGDALVMTQKYDPKVKHAPQLALLRGALDVSKSLFELKIPHRAAVSVGKVRCKLDNRAAIVTGEAVLMAYYLESHIKAQGIFFDESCREFCNWYHNHSNKDLIIRRLGWKKYIATNPISRIRPSAMLVGAKGQALSIQKLCNENPRGKKIPRTRLLLKACSIES